MSATAPSSSLLTFSRVFLLAGGRSLAETIVEGSVEEISRLPPDEPLDGSFIAVWNNGVALCASEADEPMQCSRGAARFPAGRGLKNRHLAAALNVPMTEALTIVVMSFLMAEDFGDTFLEASGATTRKVLRTLVNAVIAEAERGQES